MKAAIVGRHLYRFTVRYGGGCSLVALNITVPSKGLGAANRAAHSVMNALAFRNRFPRTVVEDVSYYGIIAAH